MKFGDKIEFGENHDIEVNLTKISDELTRVGLKLSPLDGNDYTAFAVRRIVLFSGTLVNRLRSHFNSSIEFLAWTARNLFECYLLITFILMDQRNAKAYLSQKGIDELEINEGFLSLSSENTSEVVTRPILDRNEHIKKTLEKHELKRTGYWTISMLAKETNSEDEYKAFFKFYSKYVHPSSWLINSNPAEYDTQTYRNIFLLRAQYYASCILKTAEDYKVRTK